MYVIVYNNSVILGPMRWNRFRFENTIQEECEVATTLPDTYQGPIVVSPEIKILPVTSSTDPSFNSKIEFLHGPFWTFTETEAISSYTVEPYPIDAVKSQLKSICTAERYRLENLGIKMTIQSQEVTIDVSRANRNIFVQQYLLMPDADTVQWKFPECWLYLTKTDLGQIVAGGVAYIQQQFDWESAKISEIEACTTLAQLDALVIVEPHSNMPGEL